MSSFGKQFEDPDATFEDPDGTWTRCQGKSYIRVWQCLEELDRYGIPIPRCTMFGELAEESPNVWVQVARELFENDAIWNELPPLLEIPVQLRDDILHFDAELIARISGVRLDDRKQSTYERALDISFIGEGDKKKPLESIQGLREELDSVREKSSLRDQLRQVLESCL